jgi:hypothetical protein
MNTNDTTPSSTTTEILLLLWQWRIELALMGLVAFVYCASARRVGYSNSAVIVAIAIGVLLGLPSVRRGLTRVLLVARWRRKLARALALIDLPLAVRPPKVIRAERVAGGMRLTLMLKSGTAVHELERLCPYLATHFRAWQVKPLADPTNAARVRLTIYTKDPFGDGEIAWPYGLSQVASAWSPLPLGIDEEGEEVSVSLIERNLLCGGEPGSGKSGFLNTVLASLAQDPTAALYLFDPKGVELEPWRPCANGFVGDDLNAAIEQLEGLIEVMDARYETLRRLGVRKFERGQGYGPVVVVIDELPYYVANLDNRGAKEFGNRLRDLIARGRAASMVVVVAAQKPSADTVPSFIRDLIGIRVAFRCSPREASDTVLGGGWAAQGYSATSIPMAQRGVGLVLGADGLPRLMKTYWLSDAAIRDIVGRACTLRLKHPKDERETALDNEGDTDPWN